MAGNIPFIPSKTAQDALVAFHHQCYNLNSQTWNIRENMRNIDLAFARTNDFTSEQAQAKLANRYGDPTKFQNIVLPVVAPQVEAAVAYQSAVFLTGNPIFGVVADPQNEDAALQLQTIIENDSVRGGWARQLYLFFLDGFKYNLSALEVAWETQKVPSFSTDPSLPEAKVGQVNWSGNVVRRLDPYNLVFDARYSPTEISTRGEFAGYTQMMSRLELKSFIQTLPRVIGENIIPAFESPVSAPAGASAPTNAFYIPKINPEAILQWDPRRSTDWMAWAGLAQSVAKSPIKYKNVYEVTTLYARILPSDFGFRVPEPNTPQIWKFIFVNHSVLLYAERQTNAHNMLPILFGQPKEDGLGYQTKSFAQTVQPMQEIGTALLNARIHSQRRSLVDRVVYDPSKIDSRYINSDNPAAKIPLKPAAYGTNPAEAMYKIPYQDDGAAVAFQEVQMLLGFANQITGLNQARQGQFVKGNKTVHEYESVMQNASARDQSIAMLYESQVFTPLKEILKLNILQYHTGGPVYSASEQKSVEVNPVSLRETSLTFKVSDGLLPSEKLLSLDELSTAFQALAQSPQLGNAYDLAPMFSYLFKPRGANLKPFEKSKEQLQYEQAMGAWQQAAANAAKAGAQFSTPQPIPQQFGVQTPEGAQQ